jgi:hypothetical protein
MVCTVTDFTHNSCYSCDLIVVFFGASSDAVHIYIQLLSKLSVSSYHILDFHGGTASSSCQLTNLVGYYSKASAHFTRSGSFNCGAGDVPMCMLDDQPSHLIREDGMPLGWPERLTPSC